MKQNFFQKLKEFSKTQWLILMAFVLVLSFTGFHLYHVIERAVYWQNHQDQPISKWMNIGYVAHSYHLPPPVLTRALNLPDNPRDRRPLSEIAKEQNRSFEEIKTILEQTINQERAVHSPPSGAGGQR